MKPHKLSFLPPTRVTPKNATVFDRKLGKFVRVRVERMTHEHRTTPFETVTIGKRKYMRMDNGELRKA